MLAPAPEFLGTFERQIQEYPSRGAYGLATLSPEGKPKVRFVIHRGVTPSGLFLTTTDTRMQKPVHLAHENTVEAAWWVEETACQFRMTGRAVSASDDASFKEAIKTLGLDESAEEGKPEWWAEKKEELWKNLSGHLRGSFGRPPPGTPLDQADRKPEEWPTRLDVESDDPKKKKDIEYAKSHFALIAIDPIGFEMLELKPSPNVRTHWDKQSDGSWKKTPVCP